MATIGRGGFGFVRACKAKKGSKETLVTKVRIASLNYTWVENTNATFPVVGISIGPRAVAYYVQNHLLFNRWSIGPQCRLGRRGNVDGDDGDAVGDVNDDDGDDGDADGDGDVNDDDGDDIDVDGDVHGDDIDVDVNDCDCEEMNFWRQLWIDSDQKYWDLSRLMGMATSLRPKFSKSCPIRL